MKARMTRRSWRFAATGVAWMLGSLALAMAAAPVCASTFLDDAARGREAVQAAGIENLDGAGARASAIDGVVDRGNEASPAFVLGAQLAGLNLDLDRPGGLDRTAVEHQVREVLKAQSAAGIDNRALCLLSGRSDPRSIESLMRFVEPHWTCGPAGHLH